MFGRGWSTEEISRDRARFEILSVSNQNYALPAVLNQESIGSLGHNFNCEDRESFATQLHLISNLIDK